MRYESVLGYSDNSLLTEYREKYFLSLYSDFIKLFRDSLWIQQFQKLEVHKQQKFILHPDNASVIHEFFDS
jgi:hypothetical protein